MPGSVRREIAMSRYLTVIADADAMVAVARKRPGHVGCPPTCHDCCHSGAVLPVGAVEMEHMLNALEAFPPALQAFILGKAQASVARLRAAGLDADAIMQDPTAAADAALDDRRVSACAFLIGGVCSVYEHRPIICRTWGVPLSTGDSVSCCPKTRLAVDPDPASALPYPELWRRVRVLSASLDQENKEPMAYAALRRWELRRAGEP
ncbi:hypothetical protein FJZ36_09760 [Candidatus Poribacteria bacterium]|nr:hypothetical protein [Candidatus Poribacteria bacterium]